MKFKNFEERSGYLTSRSLQKVEAVYKFSVRMSVRGEHGGILVFSYFVFLSENVIVTTVSIDDEELKFLQARWIGQYYNSVRKARARMVVPLAEESHMISLLVFTISSELSHTSPSLLRGSHPFLIKLQIAFEAEA